MGSAPAQKHPRYRAEFRVDLTTADGITRSGVTAYISNEGLFLCTPQPLSEGVPVYLAMQFPQVTLNVYAHVVRWIQGQPVGGVGNSTGLELRFYALPADAQALLKSFLFTLFRQGARIPEVVRGTLLETGEPAAGLTRGSSPGNVGTPPSTQSLNSPRRVLRAGDVLSRYAIIDLVGEGGMAQVWLARERTTAGYSHPVVLKAIAPKWAGKAEFIELFFDEGRLAAQLSHPNVVQVFDLDTDEGMPLLVMEHLQGRTLAAVMEMLARQGMTLPHALAAHIAAQCCRALDYAHNLTGPDGAPLNVIHRDVTPDNIFITYSGDVKLLDFGIARASQQSHQTLPGAVRGKLFFLSPEQVTADTQDHRVDIWAVGVNLFYMLTGAMPFSGRSELEVFTAILKQAPPRPSSVVTSIPPQMDAVVAQALEKNPERRLPRMREMQHMLDAFLTRQPVSSAQLAGVMDALFPEGSDPDRQRMAALLSAPIAEPPPPPEPLAPPLPSYVEVQFTRTFQVLAGDVVEEAPAESAAPPPDERPPPRPLHRLSPAVAAGLGAVAMGGLFVVMEHWLQAPEGEPEPVVVSTSSLAPLTGPLRTAADPLPPVDTVPPARPAEPAPPPPAPVPTGGLLMESNTEAQVFLDGALVGNAPAALDGVTGGPHRVRVVAVSGGASMELNVSVAAGEVTRRQAVFQRGKVMLNAPRGADVLVDGKRVGRTPLGALALLEGAHTVTLQRRNGSRQDVRLVVRPGKMETIRLK